MTKKVELILTEKDQELLALVIKALYHGDNLSPEVLEHAALKLCFTKGAERVLKVLGE